MREAVIVANARTPLAKSHRGSFNMTRPDDLGGMAIRAALGQVPNLDPDEIEDVIMGCGLPEGPSGHNVGRVAALAAGLSEKVPGVTVNRYCSSGLQSIAQASHRVMTGECDVVIGGGTESITLVQNDKQRFVDLVNPVLNEKVPGLYMGMGQTADIVAERYSVSREDQDAYALLSQQRVAKAQEEGWFEDISPVTVNRMAKQPDGELKLEEGVTVDKDECNRPNTTLEGLTGLKPAFSPTGTVTAGNASQLSDGASATIVMSAERAGQLRLEPLGVFRGFQVAGCRPDEMGIGPVFAVPKLLEKAGLGMDDIDIVELNEAFASQLLYCQRKLEVPDAKLNPLGGSISIGHPYGMTGSRMVGQLLRQLRRTGGKRGIVTMCIGGGMGAAGLFEAPLTRPVPGTLSEHASKQLLAGYGVPCAREVLAETPEQAAAEAARIGFPVVVKLCGDAIAHKTERSLVRLSLAGADAVRAAGAELLAKARAEDGEVALLVAEQVQGSRELIAGLVRDPQLGPCVMLGLGGILTEALGDVVFASAPLAEAEAKRLPERLAAGHLLTRPFRGEPAVDVDALAAVLCGLSRLALERPDVASVDLNPLIVRDGVPVAVDALVELSEPAPAFEAPPPASAAQVRERFRPLFEPRGIVVAGASSHPGKFGFVTLHNLLRFGYAGEVFPINRDGGDVLGRATAKDVAGVPEGAADLVFVCTPNSANVALLRACAARGVKAAFVASAGYGEAGEEGRAKERELVGVAEELGMLLVGPNGQGVISTPRSMCAQIVAPYPPPGPISVVSQSGNLVSSFLNYAVETGVGVARAVSCGNSAQTRLADFLEYFAADPETKVALAYLEGVSDGARFLDVVERFTRGKPLVLVKGGVAAEGQRAAASHTGSLATDAKVFAGLAAQRGVLLASSIEEAFEWAATLATQPLPRGRRTVVFTTVGGWGVLAADACVAAGLTLVPLPEDLLTKVDAMVPSRWSRNNPIDLAGGKTRDTIPEVLDLVTAHPDVDAVIHLGLGIQAASAQVLKSGPFYPDHGLERIVDYHERQDRRYAAAAREVSERHAKPVLSATELVHTASAYGNAGVLAVKQQGRLCHASAHRAVRALRALVAYAEFRGSA